MSDKPEVERTNEELAAMREYNEAPADALEGVPEMFHTAIHYAYRCGRTAANQRRRRELDGERIEGCEVLERQYGTTGYEVTLVFPEKEGMPESWRYGDPGPVTLTLNPKKINDDE